MEPFGFDLAKAVHEFEITNPNDRFYDDKVSHLNREIDYVIASRYFHDNAMAKELEVCEEKRKELENTLNEKNEKIQLLTEEKFMLQGKLSVYERDIPKSDTLVGDLDD